MSLSFFQKYLRELVAFNVVFFPKKKVEDNKGHEGRAKTHIVEKRSALQNCLKTLKRQKVKKSIDNTWKIKD